jgi:hypothetical protein
VWSCTATTVSHPPLLNCDGGLKRDRNCLDTALAPSPDSGRTIGRRGDGAHQPVNHQLVGRRVVLVSIQGLAEVGARAGTGRQAACPAAPRQQVKSRWPTMHIDGSANVLDYGPRRWCYTAASCAITSGRPSGLFQSSQSRLRRLVRFAANEDRSCRGTYGAFGLAGQHVLSDVDRIVGAWYLRRPWSGPCRIVWLTSATR